MAITTSTYLFASTLFLSLIKNGLAGGVADKASICTPSTTTSTSLIINTITVTLPASTITTTIRPSSKSKVPRGYSYQDSPKNSTTPLAGSLPVSHKTPSTTPTPPAHGFVTCAASTVVAPSTTIIYLTIPGPLVTVTTSEPAPLKTPPSVDELLTNPPGTSVAPPPLERASTRTFNANPTSSGAFDIDNPLQTIPPSVDEVLADPPIFNDEPPAVAVPPAGPTPQLATPTPPPAVAPLPNLTPSPINPGPVQNVSPSPEPAPGASISAVPALGVPSPVAPAPGVSPSPEPAPGVFPTNIPAQGASSPLVPPPGVVSSGAPTPNIPSPATPSPAGTAGGSLSPIAPVSGITTTTRVAPSATTRTPVQFTGAAYRDTTDFGRSALLGLTGLLIIWV